MENRTGFIGSSDIASILGLSRYKSPYQLWLEKTGNIPEIMQNLINEKKEFFERRKLAEPYILSVWKNKHKIEPLKVNNIFYDDEFQYMRSEIDFQFIDPKTGIERNGEIKSIANYSNMKEWGLDYSDDIPLEYMCQTQFGMGITKKESVLLVAMKGFDEYHEYIIHRDDELIKILRNEAKNFWELVQNNIAPERSSVDDFNYLKNNDQYVEIEEDRIALINAIKDCKSIIKSTEEELADYENMLKILIGVNEGAKINGKSVATWKKQGRESIDSLRLKEEMPDIYEKYKKQSFYRVLRIN